MSQHDYSIANQGFPATRADINNVLSAIATNNSGTSAPSTQYAGQFWIDTTSSTWTLYIHDGADDIQFATIDTSANTVNFIDSELADGSVTNAKLGADAVDGDKIADDSIDSEHYVDGSIDTAHIADSQITTAKLTDSAVTTAKIANDSVTKDKVSNLMYPAFEALGNGQQNLSNATETLVEFPNERFDTDSCYDNTSGNYKFTPNVAGKYFIYTTVRGFSTTNDQMDFMTVRLYKNGTRVNTNRITTDAGGSSGDTINDFSMNFTFIQEANGSSDYFQIKAQINCNSGTPALFGNGIGTTAEDLLFGAFRIGV